MNFEVVFYASPSRFEIFAGRLVNVDPCGACMTSRLSSGTLDACVLAHLQGGLLRRIWSTR